MQQNKTTNADGLADVFPVPSEGRIIAIDPGTKRCGVAVCDELRVTTRPLAAIERKSWKKLLLDVKQIISGFDAKALVIGLPLNTDGTESEMSGDARHLARNFSLSLDIPVFLQDERVTSYEARSQLWAQGKSLKETSDLKDSEAAAIILSDFLARVSEDPGKTVV